MAGGNWEIDTYTPLMKKVGEKIVKALAVQFHLIATPRTVARQAPLSMGFSRQEYWSGLPFLLPRDLPDPGIELVSPALVGKFFTTEPAGKPCSTVEFVKRHL